MLWLLILSLNVRPAPAPATTPPAVPGFVSSGGLGMICQADAASGGDPRLCAAYIAGATDQLLAREARRKVTRRRICVPAQATIEEVTDSVIAFQQAMGASDEVAAADMVRAALEASFPCSGAKGTR